MKETPKLPQQIKQDREKKPYEIVDESGQIVSAIKYVEGQPQNIRFNGQSGRFSVDGKEDLGPMIDIVPVAYRFFAGTLFSRANARYVEIFYVDQNRNLSVVLFTNAAADNFRKFIADLRYAKSSDLSHQVPTNTILRISAAQRVRADGGRYNVAEFENLGKANPKAVLAFRIFAMDFKIYRADTRTTEVLDSHWSNSYFTMIGTGVAANQERNRHDS